MFRPLNKRVGVLAVVWVLMAALLTPGIALAQAANGVTMTARAGFNGYCRSGNWIPVQITLNNKGAGVDGRLEVTQSPQASSQKSYAQAVSLPAQAQKALTVYLYPEGYLDSLNVRLSGSGGEVLAIASLKLICISPSDRLFGILADNSTPFNILSNLTPVNGKTYLAAMGIGDIPGKAEALEGLDGLVVSDIDSGTLTPDQQTALFSWIGRGGRLVVTGGADWKRTAAGLGAIIPIQPGGTQTISSLGGLAQFVGLQDALTNDTVVVQGTLVKTGTQKWVSQTNAGDAALVLKRPIGLGEVIYLTFDPALEPFSNWNGKENFYRQLVGMDVPRPVWGWGFQDWDAARQAVQAFPNRQTPGGIEIFGFLLVYVIVIGPVNALVLMRLKRRNLAWLTIPGLVLLFSLAAFFYGAFGYANQTALNRLAVVQIIPDDKQAHVDGLIGIISPNQSSYSIEAGTGFLAHPIPIGNQAGALSSNHPWSFLEASGGSTIIDSIQVDANGFEAFAVEGQVPAADIHGDLTLQVNGKNMLLTGVINNNSDIALENVVLLTPGGLQKLEPLGAHSSRNINFPIQSKDIQASSNGFSRPNAGGLLGLLAQQNGSLAAELAGSSAISSLQAEQRDALLSSFGKTGNQGEGSQGKIILAGWSSTSPLDAKLVGQTPENVLSTLYLVSINCKLALQGETAVLDPVLFNWQTLVYSGLSSPTPYNTYPGPGTTSFIFRPVQKSSFKSVNSLLMHLENSDNSGNVPYTISIWDYSNKVWMPIPVAGWGDYEIKPPEKFVNPDGEVRLQLDNKGNTASYLKRVDFTLSVHP